MKRHAFTLAEVLITLGIIGIVAAITIPQLVSNYQEKAHITRLKKITTELNNAFTLALSENGPVNTWPQSNSEADIMNAANNILSKYLKYVKVCDGYNNDKSCLSGEIYNMNGTKFWTTNPFDYYQWEFRKVKKYILADGAIITITTPRSDSYWCVPNSKFYHCASILVDTNGFKGPNRNGVDVFKFLILPDKIIPQGTKGDHSLQDFKSNSFGAFTAWALYNENMDYLRCYNELDWDGKHTCKE